MIYERIKSRSNERFTELCRAYFKETRERWLKDYAIYNQKYIYDWLLFTTRASLILLCAQQCFYNPIGLFVLFWANVSVHPHLPDWHLYRLLVLLWTSLLDAINLHQTIAHFGTIHRFQLSACYIRRQDFTAKTTQDAHVVLWRLHQGYASLCALQARYIILPRQALAAYGMQ